MVYYRFTLACYSVLSSVLTFCVGRAIHCSIGVQTFIGIPRSLLHLYSPKKEFKCFDGSLSIPYEWINDDYCDCPDGSDEPSTSACTNTVFHCENKGFVPLNIPSSRVNDGICDCCDGSDEYCSSIECPDNCYNLRVKAIVDSKNYLQILKRGGSIKKEMISRGKELRSRKCIRLTELDRVLEEAVKIKNRAETICMMLGGKQKDRKSTDFKRHQDKIVVESGPIDVFNETDDNDDSSLQANEILIELKSRDSEIKSISEDETTRIMHMNSELSFNNFVELSWNRLKFLLTKARGDFSTDKHSNGDTSNEFPDQTMYDDETKKVLKETPARAICERFGRVVNEIEINRISVRNFLKIDYGQDDEFLPLESECFTYASHSYNYSFRPFHEIHQICKSEGREVCLGRWKGWSTASNHTAMMYDGGDECWNGPARSARVLVTCGQSNRLYDAREPNKCTYILYFRTPAACHPNHYDNLLSALHDEL